MRSTFRLLIGLVTAPLMLASSAAFAYDPCGNLGALAQGDCVYEYSGGCTTKCQPLYFAAACNGQCTASADLGCTGGCQATCEADCNTGGIDCEGSCNASCFAGCASSCSDSNCQTVCEADCDNRCSIQCDVTFPTCEASCEASCDASCSVQANVDCDVGCSAELEGGCETACASVRGALFCNGQYVDLTKDSQACLDWLATRGISFEAQGSCDLGGCSGTLSCSVAPAVGAVDDKLGAGAVAALMMGLGLFLSRRRRA